MASLSQCSEKSKSTRSVASRRLSVRTLCILFSAPTKSSSLRSETKEDPVLPSRFYSTSFVIPGIMQRISSANAAGLAQTCAPYAAPELSCHLDLSCISVHHCSRVCCISQCRTRCPPVNSRPKPPDEPSQIRCHSIFLHLSRHSEQLHCSAPSTVLTFTSNAAAIDSFGSKIACSLSDLTRTSEKSHPNTSFMISAIAHSFGPFNETIAAPIQRSRSDLLIKLEAPRVSCS